MLMTKDLYIHNGSQNAMSDHTTHTHIICCPWHVCARVFILGLGFHKMMGWVSALRACWTGRLKDADSSVGFANKIKDWFRHQEFSPVRWGHWREGDSRAEDQGWDNIGGTNESRRRLKNKIWAGLGFINKMDFPDRIKGALHWYYGKPLISTFLPLKSLGCHIRSGHVYTRDMPEKAVLVTRQTEVTAPWQPNIAIENLPLMGFWWPSWQWLLLSSVVFACALADIHTTTTYIYTCLFIYVFTYVFIFIFLFTHTIMSTTSSCQPLTIK